MAAKVVKKLEAITAVFAKFGLKQNFRPKKTEIIFTARGREAGGHGGCHQPGRCW